MRYITNQIAALGTITSIRYEPWQSVSFQGKQATYTMEFDTPDFKAMLETWNPVLPDGIILVDLTVTQTGRLKADVCVMVVVG